MIKKKLKREKFLNQEDKCEYKEFQIMVMRKVEGIERITET